MTYPSMSEQDNCFVEADFGEFILSCSKGKAV